MKHQTKFKEAACRRCEGFDRLRLPVYKWKVGSALHHLMVWRAGGCTRSISSPRAATTAPMHRAVGRYCITV
ncbi:hypothetical protein OOU_Y34scaffold00228g23 [Pyricularia oryzae Y34]|uniref:Uncharacterized protein n=2 Tax=Pyricularia oryzae TaxID=318829 RepID=A0AA97P5M3_PYRO3|nr:hypothetical protein OOU_Y34scaffold00228g23 [Pyricularia oryzae Y34]